MDSSAHGERPGEHASDVTRIRGNELAVDDLLHRWMVVTSREPGIARARGQTKRPFDEIYWKLERQALLFLCRMISVSWPSLDNELFSRQAQYFWNFLQMEEATFECGMVLLNLRGVGDAIPLGEGILLQPVTAEWAAKRIDDPELLPGNTWALTFTYDFRRSELEALWPYDQDRLESRVIGLGLLRFRLLEPLELLKACWPNARYRVAMSESLAPDKRISIKSTIDYRLPSKVMPLDLDVLQKLEAIGFAIPAAGQGNAILELCLRHFQSAFSRAACEDQIIDLVICLEALFSRESDEVTHKVATRCALLLGRDETESVRIMKTTRSLYSLRSKIVHGGIEERQKPIKNTVTSWRGLKAFPEDKARSSYVAAEIAFEIASRALTAFIFLEASGEQPFGKRNGEEFNERLDNLAFKPGERTRIQKVAGLIL